MLRIDWEKSKFFRAAALDDFQKAVFAGTFQGLSNETMAHQLLRDNRPLKTRTNQIVRERTAGRKALKLEAPPGPGPNSFIPVLSAALKSGLNIEVSEAFADLASLIPEETRDILFEMAVEGLDGLGIAAKHGKNQNYVHDRVERGAVRTLFKDAGCAEQMPERAGLVLLNAAAVLKNKSIDDAGEIFPHTKVEIVGTDEDVRGRLIKVPPLVHVQTPIGPGGGVALDVRHPR